MISDLIPEDLKALLKELGYESLYPPQEEAIKHGALDGKNLLIATPTASGKTLIALMAAAKVIEKGKVVYLTPLRALAGEKYQEFKILEKLKGIRVMISTGELDSPTEYLRDANVLVLTNEKMDSLMRHEAEWLNQVSLFVADEVHLVGDKYRGATLEMILTKILSYYNAQLLALSATVTNAEEIASWLNCELIDMDWRPVNLIEGVYEHGEIIFSNDDRVSIKSSNRGAAIDLALDSIANGGQALIFTETRKRAVSLALKASDAVNTFLTNEEKIRCKNVAKAIIENDDTEVGKNLAHAVSNGVAFHHAGLNHTSRKIIEDSYRNGIIKVLTATPTLAAGVNLPARRVIISNIHRYDQEEGMSEISVMEYKQMCGRAGRPKYDTIGESIIVTTDAEEMMRRYINGKPEPLRSSLINEKSLRIHILSTIASMPGIKKEELLSLFSRTLMAKHYRESTIEKRVNMAIDYLLNEELVKSKGEKVRFIATDLGRLCSILYIDPVTAVSFRDALLRARKGNHTIGLLHLITESPDFPRMQLRSKDIEEARMLLEESDELVSDADEPSRSMLALYSWINESSEKFILENLGIEPGDMYRMVDTGEWLMHSLYEVAKLMKSDLMQEIYTLHIRVKHGVKEELVPLISLEGIGRVRARALYNAGFRDIESIKDAPLDKLASIPKIGLTIARKLKEK